MGDSIGIVSDDGAITEVVLNQSKRVDETHIVLEHVAGGLYLHRQIMLNGFDMFIGGEPVRHYVDFYAIGRELTDDSVIYVGSTYDDVPQLFECKDDADGSVLYRNISIPVFASEFNLSEDDEVRLTNFIGERGYECLATIISSRGMYTYGDMKQIVSVYEVIKGFAASHRTKTAERKTKRRYSKTLKQVECQTDPLIKAIAGRASGSHFSAADYWVGPDSKEIGGVQFGRELSIKTHGEKGRALMRVAAPPTADIMSHPSTYQIGARDQYFLDAAATLVFDGRKNISCAQLLKLCGFSNPYAENMAKTREYALNACKKARFLPICLDVTDSECKWQGKYQVSRSTIITTLAKWDIKETYVEGEENAVKDFEIICTGSPEEIMPLAAISREWEMITRISIEQEKFKTVKTSMADKLAWRYIVKQVYASGMSNTIKFETMFRDLDLDNIDEEERSMSPYEVKRRRERVIAKLGKMLKEKCDEKNNQRLFLSWKYTKDEKTGEVSGVKITPLKTTRALS